MQGMGWRALSATLVVSVAASMLVVSQSPAEAATPSGPSTSPADASAGAAPEAAPAPSPGQPLAPPALASPPPRRERGPATPATPSRGPFDPARATLVERTRSADIYENPDGTRTVRSYAGPANWKDGAGRWHAIDPTLVADGARGFKNRSGEVRFTFASRADIAATVRASAPGWSVAFGLEGARRGAGPHVEGQTIRYPEVGDGVDLEYTVGIDALKEVVVLDRPPAGDGPATFRFPLSLSGVTPHTEPDGSIAFVDRNGATVAAIPPGTMHDASGDPAAGLEPASAPVPTRLVRDGGRWVVELAPDRAWLDDPARTYPISVDPSFYAGGTTYGADAFVGSGCGNCTYNGDGQLDGGAYTNKVGYSWYNNGWWEWRTYLYYDVGPANGQDILRADWYGSGLVFGVSVTTFRVGQIAGDAVTILKAAVIDALANLASIPRRSTWVLGS